MPDHRARLAAIKRFDQLVAYLRDDMGWPIEGDDFEEITFDYTPEELGIDAANRAKIQEIKRLRPLAANQPWGIFFVKFEPKRLPVVALRRILSRVVLKKRASANSAERAAWDMADLLFISNYGDDAERRISFAHFVQNDDWGDLPTLKVLGWDGDDTNLHLDHVAQELTTKLRWPDDEADVPGWRATWGDAFTLRHREVITTAKRLAERLADLARETRKKANAALAIESPNGPLRTLMDAFKKALIHDLDEDGFADMYAQTIAYGLLSARISRPEGLVADNMADMVPVTNPFLKEMLESFLRLGGRRRTDHGWTGIDFDELGINEIVQLLREANMEAVLRDFGDRNPQEDPVIHFYEHFLKEYDAQKRMQRGVFYTPRPVVSYIVRSVHELLQTEFGLADGLADTATWGEMLERFPPLPAGEGRGKGSTGLKLPLLSDLPGETQTISPDEPFVQILDPATGTATFLVEVIDVIHQTLKEKWKQQRLSEADQVTAWNDYVPRHLLPRLHGFELMMAPYAIAHMKIGLKLAETGYRFGSDERARIYLTNALEPWMRQLPLIGFEALAHEAEAVNDIKRRKRFTVVIGNPPYSVASWNTGEWISSLCEVYKGTVRAEETQIQALSNDYIKFLRFGEWHVEQAGVGLLGFITGHGYLSGTQPRDMRNHLAKTFHRCYCLDLHGSVRRAGPQHSEDQPIFEIMTGVAILVGCRGVSYDGIATTTLKSLPGRSENKLAYLRESAIGTVSSPEEFHRPAAPYFYFAASVTPQDIDEEYHRYPDLPAIFGTGNRQPDKEVFWATGFASQQDELAMSFSRAELEQKVSALANSGSFDELRQSYRLCTTNQWDYAEAKDFALRGLWRQHVGLVSYRPFDRQWTVLHKHVLTILRKQVMSQLGGEGRNIGLVSSRAVNDLRFAHCFVTNEPVDKIFISSKTSTNAYVFPLFVRGDDMYGERRRPNFSRSFLTLLGRTLYLQADPEHGLPAGLTPQDIFHYIYAVFHSPGYRSRYSEFLKIDFPRLPLTGDLTLFRALVELGGELVALHLLESPTLDQPMSELIGSRNPEIEKPTWSEDTVWVDKRQTTGFKGVPEDVWNFHIGGYQVCHKWLKDRKGRTLSDDDIAHYHKIVVALSETIRLMQEIDAVIDEHGGWPGAFAPSTGEQA